MRETWNKTRRQGPEPRGPPKGWGAGSALGSLKSSDYFSNIGGLVKIQSQFFQVRLSPLHLTLLVALWKFHLPVGMHVCVCGQACVHTYYRGMGWRIGTWELSSKHRIAINFSRFPWPTSTQQSKLGTLFKVDTMSFATKEKLYGLNYVSHPQSHMLKF